MNGDGERVEPVAKDIFSPFGTIADGTCVDSRSGVVRHVMKTCEYLSRLRGGNLSKSRSDPIPFPSTQA